MHLTLAQKARQNRMSALMTLPSRKEQRAKLVGLAALPPLGQDEIGAIFATTSSHFDQNNIFLV